MYIYIQISVIHVYLYTYTDMSTRMCHLDILILSEMPQLQPPKKLWNPSNRLDVVVASHFGPSKNVGVTYVCWFILWESNMAYWKLPTVQILRSGTRAALQDDLRLQGQALQAFWVFHLAYRPRCEFGCATGPGWRRFSGGFGEEDPMCVYVKMFWRCLEVWFKLAEVRSSCVPPNHPFLVGFSIVNHPFGGTHILGNLHM